MTVHERLMQLALAADASRLEADKAAVVVGNAGDNVRHAEAELKEATRHCLRVQAEALRRYEALSATLAATILHPEESEADPFGSSPAREGGAA